MCNIYNVSTNQEAIHALTRTFKDMAGNLQQSLDVYSDYAAPVVRNVEDGPRELANLRWGMPSPPQYTGPPITIIRNTASSRRWLGPSSRCVGPATTFSEWGDTKPKKTKRWSAINEERPLFRRHLDQMAQPAQKSGRPDGSLDIRVSDNGCKRGCEADPPEGNAGYSDNGLGDRDVADGGFGRGIEASTPSAGTAFNSVTDRIDPHWLDRESAGHTSYLGVSNMSAGIGPGKKALD